jgi:hypothetical protein
VRVATEGQERLEVLQAVIAGKQTANGNVRGFARKWRATVDEDGHYSFAEPL